MKLFVLGASVILIGLGSAQAQPPPNYAPIPPPRSEMVPPPPGGRMIWQPGHWQWDGHRYVWIRGHYVERRRHSGHYAEGHWRWSQREGRYVWMPAHWE
jgi:hypothetical protein